MTKRISQEAKTTMNIGVPPGAQKALKAFCEQKMVKQRLVLSRIMTWFLEQKPFVQSVVTGTVDRGMEKAYAAALRQLADEIEAGGDEAIISNERGPGPPRRVT